ncbi:MAG TPA: hypothetical protein VGI65_19390 [Steroidobacteraceae bacterium]|jgi:hypothetical protein
MTAHQSRYWRLACAVAFSALGVEPCIAGRAAGESVVYEITQVTNNKADLSSLPAMIRGRAEANQAAANGKKITTTLTLSTDKLDDDGSAHVLASYHQSMEGISGVAATAFSAAKKFQGTLTPDGRVLPAYDPGVPATLDSHGFYSEAEKENIAAQSMLGTFGNFNTFVAGVVKHPQLKDGDVWHLVVQDAFGISRQYDFSVNASEVSMVGNFSAAHSSMKLMASGRYDSARRLLIDYHEENTYETAAPNGIASSGVSTSTFKLVQ